VPAGTAAYFVSGMTLPDNVQSGIVQIATDTVLANAKGNSLIGNVGRSYARPLRLQRHAKRRGGNTTLLGPTGTEAMTDQGGQRHLLNRKCERSDQTAERFDIGVSRSHAIAYYSVLTANRAANILTGDDVTTILGSGGDDHLVGNAGANALIGGAAGHETSTSGSASTS
jgi:Ca2+-binding RTX toxin-like protein